VENERRVAARWLLKQGKNFGSAVDRNRAKALLNGHAKGRKSR